MKARWIGLGIGAALCLAACGDAARPAVVEGSASPADATAGAGIVAAATAPYARAERALAAGRILAPAGDNAIEHYLDACAQPSERVRARAALAELQPYVLIAAEQAIARGDGREAARLQALIARIDSSAPALPRLLPAWRHWCAHGRRVMRKGPQPPCRRPRRAHRRPRWSASSPRRLGPSR